MNSPHGPARRLGRRVPAFLVLRFDAPLMSFGGVLVDNVGTLDEFPGQAMITGLCANALGYEHVLFDELQELQRCVCFAARIDRAGEMLTDYQTVDLGQTDRFGHEWMQAGWTSCGRVEGREGGPAGKGTHIRYRRYWADRVVTICLGMAPGAGASLDLVRNALRAPARPLFLGRKCCLPSTPVFHDSIEASDVLDGLARVPPVRRGGRQKLPACWPAELGPRDGARLVRVTDERDWKNQAHVGRRRVYHGYLDLGATA